MSGCYSPSNDKDRSSCAARDLTSQRWPQFLWTISLGAFIAGCFFPSWRALLWSTGLILAGLLCVVNAVRCGRLHCYITGPLFLLGGIVSALRGLGLLSWSWNAIGNVVAVGAVISCLLECLGGRYVRQNNSGIKQ
jgi:hypothetical protein